MAFKNTHHRTRCPPSTPLGNKGQLFFFLFYISLEPVFRQGWQYRKGISGYAEYFYILSEKKINFLSFFYALSNRQCGHRKNLLIGNTDITILFYKIFLHILLFQNILSIFFILKKLPLRMQVFFTCSLRMQVIFWSCSFYACIL